MRRMLRPHEMRDLVRHGLQEKDELQLKLHVSYVQYSGLKITEKK